MVAVGEDRIVMGTPDTRTVQSIGQPTNTGDSEWCRFRNVQLLLFSLVLLNSVLVLFKAAYFFFWRSLEVTLDSWEEIESKR